MRISPAGTYFVFSQGGCASARQFAEVKNQKPMQPLAQFVTLHV
jgi:hypothetical protein